MCVQGICNLTKKDTVSLILQHSFANDEQLCLLLLQMINTLTYGYMFVCIKWIILVPTDWWFPGKAKQFCKLKKDGNTNLKFRLRSWKCVVCVCKDLQFEEERHSKFDTSAYDEKLCLLLLQMINTLIYGHVCI